MKKRISLIIVILCIAVCSIVLGACASGGRGKVDGLFDVYNPTYNPYVEPSKVDEGMTIDGKADEAVWNDESQIWWEGVSVLGQRASSQGAIDKTKYPKLEVESKVTTHFGENGLYFFASVDDPVINVWDETNQTGFFEPWQTGISFYVCRENTETGDIDRNGLEIHATASGKFYVGQYHINAFVKYPKISITQAARIRGGNLNAHGSGTAEGYDIEMFIPWETLRLEGKPERIRAKFALVRHPNVYNFNRVYEHLDASAWTDQTTWVPFTENGKYYIPAAPTGYTIDGLDDDWSNYNGEVERVEFTPVELDQHNNPIYYDAWYGNVVDASHERATTRAIEETDENADPRYIEYKMVKTPEGLIVFVDALQRLYLDSYSENCQNTNVELQLKDKQGNSVQLIFSSVVGPNMTSSAWTCEQTQIELPQTGEKLKKINAELFISNEAFLLYEIDFSAESMKVGFGFRNGTYRPWVPTDTVTIDTHEVVYKQTAACHTVNMPFIFFAYGHTLYGSDYRRYSVGENGIFSGVYTDPDFTLDGKDDDAGWASYDGVEAKAIGRADNGNTADVGKGFTAKAKKGTDGVYVYAVAKHAKLSNNEFREYRASDFAVYFAITNDDYTSADDAKWLVGKTIHLSSIGLDNNDCAMYRNSVKGEDGLYTTVIEAFVPYFQVMGSLTTTDDTENSGGVNWEEIYDLQTGETADGYSLRVGFEWIDNFESAHMQYRGNDICWREPLHYSMPSFKGKSITARDGGFTMHWLDENGLRNLAVAPIAVDWSAYEGDVVRISDNVDESHYADFKAVLLSDGLHIRTEAKQHYYYEGNAFSDYANNWSTWYRNTNYEIYLNATDGTSDLGQFTAGMNGWSTLEERGHAQAVWKISEAEDGGYDVTIDVFIKMDYLKSTLGVTEAPSSVTIGYAFSNFNTSGITTTLPVDWGWKSTARYPVTESGISIA